jgi:hypothetical protein
MNVIQSGTKWCRHKESKTHRAVSFSETNETYETLDLEDYSDEEITGTWYNDSELLLIAYKCHKIIRRMRKTDIGKSDQYCSRGLERMVRARHNDKLKRCKKASFDTVFFEQEVQYEDGTDDQELIAKLYHAVSAQCQIEAAKLGLSDEYAVDRYLSRERRVTDDGDLPKLKKDLFPPSAPTPIPTNRRTCVVATTA